MKVVPIFILTVLILITSGMTLAQSGRQRLCQEENSEAAEIYTCASPDDVLGLKTKDFLKENLNIIGKIEEGPNKLQLALELKRIQSMSERGIPLSSKDYIDVLSKSQTGSKLIECFKQAHPSLPLEFTPVKEHPYFKEIVESVGAPPKGLWDPGENKLYVDGDSDSPVYTLVTLAHELQHACDDDYLDKGNNKSDQEATQEHLLCEIKGYKTGFAIFSELASANPQIACTEMSYTLLFQKDDEAGAHMNLGQFFNKIEEMSSDNTFVTQIIRRYNMNPEFLFSKDRDGNFEFDEEGSLILLPGFKKKIDEI